MDQGSVGIRRVILVGKAAEARRFIRARSLPADKVVIATHPSTLKAHPAPDSWIIMLPSFWDLPHHYWLSRQARDQEERGARVEWV